MGGAGLEQNKERSPGWARQRQGAGAGAAVGLTLPSRGMGTGGREGTRPRTLRVQGRSWERGWCIMSDARGVSGGFPWPPPPGFCTSNVSLAVACLGRLPLREK